MICLRFLLLLLLLLLLFVWEVDWVEGSIGRDSDTGSFCITLLCLYAGGGGGGNTSHV